MSRAGAGRVAVVTGGARGLGRGAVDRLLADGYRVAIIDTIEPVGDPPVGEWRFRRGDVTDRQFIESVAGEVVSQWGAVDALLNNAGIFPRRPALELDDDEWRQVLTVNLGGTFICAQVFGRLMYEGAGGAIVNTASGQVYRPNPNSAAYAASKGGIVSLTRALAVEWAPKVRVNCLVPGMADTAMPRLGRSEDSFQAAARQIPLGRAATARDTAAAVAFLLSDDASYITGQTLGVNGGAVMI